MDRFHFWGRILIGLVVLALLIGGAGAVYRAGWTQGFQASMMANAITGDGGKNSAAQLIPFMGFYNNLFNPSPVNSVGLFWGIGLLVLVVILFSGMFHHNSRRHWANECAKDLYGEHGIAHEYEHPWLKEMREFKAWKRQRQQAGSETDQPQSEDKTGQ